MHFFSRKSKTTPDSTNNQNGEDFDEVANKLIDSLRPMFAAHPDTDEIRLDVIQEEIVRDGEAGDGLDSIMENLDDMNLRVCMMMSYRLSLKMSGRQMSKVAMLGRGEWSYKRYMTS